MKIIDILNKVHNVSYIMISKHNNPNNIHNKKYD